MTSSTRQLPIFPLPLVLLPQALQPLHVFEPRYRQLLIDCLSGSGEFGIIYRTPDVAEREIPAGTAGCIGRIQTAQSLPDGRSNILVVGGDRFLLRAFLDDPAPYHVAVVELFSDEHEPSSGVDNIAERVRRLFAKIGRSARVMQDDTTPLPELPLDPAGLSFSIAQFINLGLSDQQFLLQSRSPRERLQAVEAALAPMVESMERRADVHTRATSNGHGGA